MSGISHFVWRGNLFPEEEIRMHLAQIYEYLPGGCKSLWENKESRPKKSYCFKNPEEVKDAINGASPEIAAWKDLEIMDEWLKNQHKWRVKYEHERTYVAERPREGEIEKSITAALNVSHPNLGRCDPSKGIGVRCRAGHFGEISVLIWECEGLFGIDFGGGGGGGTLKELGRVLGSVGIELGCAEIIFKGQTRDEKSNEETERGVSLPKKIKGVARGLRRKLGGSVELSDGNEQTFEVGGGVSF